MRLIDADKFKENILSGLYIFCQENKEDIARAIDDEPTIKTFTLADIEEQYRKGLEKGLSEWETERPKGEWIEEGTEIGAFGIKYTWNNCNKCGWNSSLVIPKNFCPNCGADMRGEQNA